MPSQTVRKALDEKRAKLKGKVMALHLCKAELFYSERSQRLGKDSVYPVSIETAREEGAFFGCEVQEV